MKRLVEIGFVKAGEWKIVDGCLSALLTDCGSTANILYAFISNDDVHYVGKSKQTLKKRLYGYQNPGPTQYTNIKCKKLIRELLTNGKSVHIYALPDDATRYVGSFHLNLAAGLEDSIIATLKPRWNVSGK